MAKPPIRVSIAAPLTTREIARVGTFQTDSMMINCYKESSPDGKVYTVKRPGLITQYTYNSGGATNGQGLAYWLGSIFAMGSNTLYRLTGSFNGSSDGTAWAASTSAPWAARTNHVTVPFNGSVYVLGGINSTGAFWLNDVWSTQDMIHWTQLNSAAPWTARDNFAAATIGNTLFIMGGLGAGATFGDVWSTQDGVTWTQVVGTAPWTARSGHAALSFNQGIIIMGGRDPSGTLLNDVWFSPDGSNWTQLVQNASWSARQLFAALYFNGKLWVAGGIAGATVATVYSSPDGITWTNTGSLPATRRAMAATVYAGQMWFIGGTDNGAATRSTVYATADGITFTTPSAAYGGGPIAGAGAVSWLTQTAVAGVLAPSIWLVGGTVGGTESQQIYLATLNVAMPSSFAIATAGTSATQFDFTTQNAGQYLVFKNTSDAWVLYAGAVTKITSTNYPQSTVRGVVNLDDTVYVMDVNGVIYGSNLSDPLTWSALNFITADYESDQGVMLVKYGQYVLALKSTTLQFFQDTGSFPGSPLRPIQGANQRVGCVSASTVAFLDNNVFFVATGNHKGRYLATFNGFQATRISNPDVERILDAWTPGNFRDTAFAVRVNGHDFYILTLFTVSITLAYDINEKTWHVWQTGTSGTFGSINYLTDGINDYLQDTTVGKVYLVDPSSYTDSGSTITVTATGVEIDGGRSDRKFVGSGTLIGDRRSSSSPNTVTISWSDDDGQTYSAGSSVDLTTPRPNVSRLGSFRIRRFRVTHASTNPFRVESLELEVA